MFYVGYIYGERSYGVCNVSLDCLTRDCYIFCLIFKGNKRFSILGVLLSIENVGFCCTEIILCKRLLNKVLNFFNRHAVVERRRNLTNNRIGYCVIYR